MSKVSRDSIVSVRLTKDERQVLEQMAKFNKMSLSQALRSLIKPPFVAPVYGSPATTSTAAAYPSFTSVYYPNFPTEIGGVQR